MAYIDIIHALLPDNATGDITASDLRQCFDLVDENIGKLVQIQENGNTGYRLYNKDANFYGEIGHDAVDISTQTENSATRGATGRNSFAVGYQTTSAGRYSYAGGYETIAQNDYQTSIGKHNTSTSTETIFEVGIGADASNRTNALEIYSNGRIIAPELNTITDPKSLTTKEYVDITATLQINDLTDVDINTPLDFEVLLYNASTNNWENQQVPQNSTGLERITEINTGYRLVHRIVNHYGNIGTEAIDLSFSDILSGSNGATGDYSFAGGYNTIAQNNSSVAFGKYNIGTSSETILEIGNGTSDIARLNLFEIYQDGRIIAPELNTITDSKSLTTKEYVDDNISNIDLGELNDVNLAAVQNGDLIMYNAGNWVNTDTLDLGSF